VRFELWRGTGLQEEADRCRLFNGATSPVGSAHQWYGETLPSLGTPEQQVIAEFQRAHDLDPLSSVIVFALANTYIAYRDFDLGIQILNKLVQDDPGFARAHQRLFLASWGKRMYPEAVAEFRKFSQLSGDQTDAAQADALEEGFHSSGWNGALAKSASALIARRKSGYVSPYIIAAHYAGLGDTNETFGWLNTALEEHDENLLGVRTDFMFDFLRSDRRYADLFRRIGLPQ
jgi:tetratricopeptide (TPR) repeat protein